VRNGLVQVRDTKLDGSGPINQFTPVEWEAFTAAVRDGQFNLPDGLE